MTNSVELPGFNWLDMFINGIKTVIVGVGYTIPLMLILVFGGLFLGLTVGSIGISNGTLFSIILIVVAILYLILIFPVLLMSLANMAFYDGDLGSAFKFREIFNKISNIGWGAKVFNM